MFKSFFRGRELSALFFTALCFSLTSGVWLSWEYHLSTLVEGQAVDLLTMVAGYGMQALGTGLFALLLKRGQAVQKLFHAALSGFALSSFCALMTHSLFFCILCGLLLNLFCGALAGHYLTLISNLARKERFGILFGGGYALSTLLIFLLSLPGQGTFLSSRLCLPVYLLLSIACLKLCPLPARSEDTTSAGSYAPSLLLVSLTLVLISLVKNLGFSFPSAHIAEGIRVETARLFYALGLLTAGMATDHDRQWGALSAGAALVIPFVMLALTGETLSLTVLWALNYIFFGFFSVFRVVLFLDLSRDRGHFLSPLGLAAGRIGDALGTALCILLGASKSILVFVTLALFLPSIWLLVRCCRTLFEKHERAPSEEEIFESFSLQHDLSMRERDVLRLLLLGRTNAEIAEALFVTESTAKFHVHNILQKTGCRSRSDLLKRYHLIRSPAAAQYITE